MCAQVNSFGTMQHMEKLVGSENWSTWSFAMKTQLELEDAWQCVEPAEGATIDSTKDRTARCKMILAIDKNLFVHVKDCKTSSAVWKALKNLFQDSGLDRRIGLLQKLCSVQLTDCSSVEDYVNQIISTAQKLNEIGFSVNDEWIGSLLLKGLPSEYKPMIMTIGSTGKALTADSVKMKLLQDVKFETASSNNALVTRSGNISHTRKKISKQDKKGKSRCFNCDGIGHFASECPSKGNKKSSSDSKGNSMFAAFRAEAVMDDWYIDSGATDHMTAHRNNFDEIFDFKGEIKAANNTVMNAVGKGNISMQMSTPSGSGSVVVNDVLHVPSLGVNLLSIKKIVDHENSVIFDRNGCIILNSEKDVIATANEINGLYKLNVAKNHNAYVVKGVSNDIWHRRLGHLGSDNMKLLSKGYVEGVQLSNDTLTSCVSCAEGKQHRKSFPAEGSRSSGVLDIIHSDVCGPMEVKSIKGSLYFVTFIDDYTRRVAVYFIKKKDEVLSCFLDYKSEVENQQGATIKILRTDNGKEYVNKAMETELKKSGIIHQTTVPYTPEQNGLSERMNRTLLEKSRAMMSDANMPKIFWAEAVNCACYIINRSPHKMLDKTPEELWSKHKPNVSYFRIFGCTAMSHIPKQKRRKLDSKSEKCVFVGYSTTSKGYRLYSLQRKEVFVCRDVIFHEDDFHYSTNQRDECKEISHYSVIVGANGDDVSEVQSDFESCSSVPIDDPEVGDSNEDQVQNLETLTSENVETVEAAETADEATVSIIRRSERLAQKHRKAYNVGHVQTADDPMSVEEAMRSNERDMWIQAMKSEIQSLEENQTWTSIEKPADANVIKTKWVFKKKKNPEGTRFKARLVVKGFTQKKGIDYEETYSPVVRYTSIRYLMALASKYNLDIQQMDAVTAFLQGELSEDIFIERPQGISDGKDGQVLKLNKAVYGLKQSSLVWNTKLDHALKKFGLTRSKVDPCIYFHRNGKNMTFIAIYVDDILLFTNEPTYSENLKSKLMNEFKMKFLGEAKQCLGIRISRSEGDIYLDQEEYISQMLIKFNMDKCNPVTTPTDVNVKLSKEMSPKTAEERKEMSEIPYQQAIGSLIFASQCTRPDICLAVNKLSKFNNCPGKDHWSAVKRIFRYLQGTKSAKLKFSKNGNRDLIAYSDSDWAGDSDERRSVTGYVCTFQGGPVSWTTKHQPTIALSTTEAEYMALSATVQEIMWLRGLNSELHPDFNNTATTVYCDNQSAIHLASTSKYLARSKHIDVRHHFIREKKELNIVNFVGIGTDAMVADNLTKAVPADKHKFCSIGMGLYYQ